MKLKMDEMHFNADWPGRPEHPLYDVHVHFGSSDVDDLVYSHLLCEVYLPIMEQCGIAKANAFAPYRTRGYKNLNAEILAFCRNETNGKVRPFCRVGGQKTVWTTRRPWQLRVKAARMVKGYPDDTLGGPGGVDRFDGVKLLPLVDGLPNDEYFKAIGDLKKPVLVHGGNWCSPEFIEAEIIRKLPDDHRVVIAHLGAFPMQENLYRQALGVLDRHPSVVLDTSGVLVSSILKHAVDHVGRRLVFGSDCPLTHPAAAWAQLAAVCDDAGLLRRIGWELPQEVFGAA